MPRTEEYEERKVAEREDRAAAWHRLVEAWNRPLSPKPLMVIDDVQTEPETPEQREKLAQWYEAQYPLALTNFARLTAQCQDAWREVYAAQTMRDARVLAHLNSLHEGSDV